MTSLHKLLLPLLFVLPAMVSAQDNNEELLDWNEEKRLQWNDFKSKPDPRSDAAASTTTYLGIEYSFSNNVILYKIACRFSKNKSWGLHQTEYILAHEQGHFDIAEIFARKLHMKMKNYKFNRSTYRQDLKKIYDEILDEKEMWQNTYDEETRHSIDRKKQAAWLEKIAQELTKTKDYANYSYTEPSLASQTPVP